MMFDRYGKITDLVLVVYDRKRKNFVTGRDSKSKG